MNKTSKKVPPQTFKVPVSSGNLYLSYIFFKTGEKKLWRIEKCSRFRKRQNTILSRKMDPQLVSSSNHLFSVFAVLNRVQEFLPKLAEADAELQNRLAAGSVDELNIENVDDDQPVIEMVSLLSIIIILCCSAHFNFC